MDMDESDRCLQNQHCPYARALKRNGKRHRFCAFHRERANEAQRRWHKRPKHAPRRPYTRQSDVHVAAVSMASVPGREHGILDDEAALDGLVTLVVEFELATTTRSDSKRHNDTLNARDDRALVDEPA